MAHALPMIEARVAEQPCAVATGDRLERRGVTDPHIVQLSEGEGGGRRAENGGYREKSGEWRESEGERGAEGGRRRAESGGKPEKSGERREV